MLSETIAAAAVKVNLDFVLESMVLGPFVWIRSRSTLLLFTRAQRTWKRMFGFVSSSTLVSWSDVERTLFYFQASKEKSV